MPDSIHDSLAAQNAFANKLAEKPPANKEEAEVASLVAEAFASLAAADKTRDEIRDSASRSARLQRWVQFAVGVLGLTGTIGGAFGTFYFLKEFEEEKATLAAKEKTIEKATRDIEASVKVKEFADESVKLSKERELVLDMKNRITLDQLDVKGKELVASESRIKEEQAALSSSEQDVKRREDAAKEDLGRLEKQRAETEALKLEIANLPLETRKLLRAKVKADSRMAVALDSAPDQTPVSLPMVPSVASDSAVNAFATKVNELFDPAAKVRSDAYDALSFGKDRANQALLEALVKVGRQQLGELKKLESASSDPSVKAELFRLRRGLENVVVTIRDMSRTVTKAPIDNRKLVLVFAEELIPLTYGVGQEAKSLKNWLLDEKK